MTYTINHFIQGKVYQNPQNQFQDIFNPATGEVAGKAALANKADVDKAIAAAKAAFPQWSATTAARRSRVLFKFNSLLNENLEQFGGINHQRTW